MFILISTRWFVVDCLFIEHIIWQAINQFLTTNIVDHAPFQLGADVRDTTFRVGMRFTSFDRFVPTKGL